MGADLVTLAQVQPVGRATVRPDAGVQVDLAAAEPYRFIVDPRQQLTSKPLATVGLNRRQVVYIDVSSPAQAGALPKPGDGHGIDILAVKDPTSLLPCGR
jgi:hypothetical protein